MNLTPKRLKLLANVLVIASILALVAFMLYHGSFKNLTPTELSGVIKGYGPIGPVVYVLMFTLVPLTLFPDSVLAISSGIVFGFSAGLIYTVIGALCGAALSYALARFLGREFIQRLTKRDITLPWLANGRNTFVSILLLRLIPLFPFDLISYGAGFARLGFKPFLAATLVGIIPGAAIYVNIGDKATKPASIGFAAAILALLILVLISILLRRSRLFKANDDEATID